MYEGHERHNKTSGDDSGRVGEMKTDGELLLKI